MEGVDAPYLGSYYDGIEPGSIPATTNTAYKWSFASKKTRVDDDALRAARADVGAATYGQITRLSHDTGPSTSGTRPASSGRIQGPAMPSAADLTLARELTKEQREEERAYQKKREKLDAKDRLEEMVGPKSIGKEAILEKKRAKREGDRTFRERGDDGLELDESTLMGGGDSFREQCVHVSCIFLFLRLLRLPLACFFFRMARRDSNKSRFSQKAEEKQNVMRERSSVYKEKEKVRRVISLPETIFNLCRFSHQGHHGYVPATSKTKIRVISPYLNITLLFRHV